MSFLRVVQGTVGVTMIAAGCTKFFRPVQLEFDHFGYPPWFRIFTGITEVTAGTAMLAGLRDPRLAAAGGTIAATTMAGAVYSHLARGQDPPAVAAPAAMLLGLTGWVAVERSRQTCEALRQTS